MSRLAGMAERLTTGSTTVARRVAAATAAWVTRGRREDLTGWRAALGCWARIVGLTLALYLLWRLLRAVPILLSLLSAVWVVAAWRAGKSSEAAAEHDGGAPAAPRKRPSAPCCWP